MHVDRRPVLSALLSLAVGCTVAGGGGPTPTDVERAAEVVGNDHRLVTTGFLNGEPVHRADIAALISEDRFAIGGVVLPTDDYDDPGEGRWWLYDVSDDALTGGSLGTGVYTVRVADGCYTGGQRWAWYAWMTDSGVRVRRLSSSGAWGGISVLIPGARYPVVVRGTTGPTTDKVLLLYEVHTGGRSYLRYRFLSCAGGLGAEYSLRSVGDPWYIWHIEAAYNTHAGRWQVFWDERNPEATDWYTDLRTKWLRWDGVHSDSIFVCNCAGGNQQCPVQQLDSTEQPGDLPSELAPDTCEDFDYPEDFDTSSGEAPSPRSPAEGCKRFHASYDPGPYNGGHQFLLSMYPASLHFISEDGRVISNLVDLDTFAIPLTGVCNVQTCSYQQIGQCGDWDSDQRLSHIRFTETGSGCSGGDDPECTGTSLEEYPITPQLYASGAYPLAIANNSSVAVALYMEGPPDAGGFEALYLTVINNY